MRCAECGRTHCEACSEAYAKSGGRVQWRSNSAPPGSEISHLMVAPRESPWGTSLVKMCEWEQE